MKGEKGVILALDVSEEHKALEVCNEVKEYVAAIKVGYPLILNTGLEFISQLKQFKRPIIADFKVADIPIISSRICEMATRNGAEYVIIHGFVGEDVVKKCSEVAKIFVVADMSHYGAKDFVSEESGKIAKVAKKYAYGIVAPATRPEAVERLRKIVGDLIIISPGVKAQGAEVGDAIKAGADFEIIGRGIYEADDPRKAAREYMEIIRNL